MTNKHNTDAICTAIYEAAQALESMAQNACENHNPHLVYRIMSKVQNLNMLAHQVSQGRFNS